MDGFQITEQHHQNRQANRRLRRGNRQDEEDKDLPGQIVQVMRKSDEIHIHRQQHQLD